MKVMQIIRMTGLMALAILPSGCITYSLEELRHVTPTGTAFQKALAKEYLAFSSQEEKEYDWFDSMYFADKGLQAAYGKATPPEDLAGWDIADAAAKADLEQGRAKLVVALAQYSESKPELAARAQGYFDCWVEQQEEGWQAADIARCRDGMTMALAQLSGEMPVMPDAPAPRKVENLHDELTAVPTVNLDVLLPETAVVFFEPGEAAVTSAGSRAIRQLVAELKKHDHYTLTVNGYTDTVGEEKDNLALSQKRAQMVKENLVDEGVSESVIRVFAFGESDPKIRTADNVDEPANNRVEVIPSE